MGVGVLIGVMIAIVVGIGIVPLVLSSLEPTVTDNITESVGEATHTGDVIVEILPFIVMAVILIGAIIWIGGPPFGHRESDYGPKESRKASLKGSLSGLGRVVMYPFRRRKYRE